MIDLRVELPERELRSLRLIDPRAVRKSEVQALNRTAKNSQEFAITLVANEMGITKSKLKKRGRGFDLPLSDAGKKSGKFGAISQGKRANARTLRTSVFGFGRPFNVGRWDGKQIKAGAMSSLDGKRRQGTGRVVATEHSAYGRRQVAVGTWQLKNRAIVVRDGPSFRGVYGPGVAQVLDKERNLRPLRRHTAERFDHHFGQALEFFFSRAGARFIR